MSNIALLRKMISSTCALYAVDLGVQLGIFKKLASNKSPIGLDDFIGQLSFKCEKSLVLKLLKIFETIGIIHIDPSGVIRFADKWEEALTDETSVNYIATLPRCYIAPMDDFSKFPEIFVNGGSIPWQSMNSNMVNATSEDAIRSANYFIKIIDEKFPRLKQKLSDGTVLFDVGCSAGHSTIRLAKEFPNSEFVGYDILPVAIDLAKAHASSSGLKNVSFKHLCATRLPKNSAEIIILSDAFHEMDVALRSDALISLRSSLKKGGGLFFSDQIEPVNESVVGNNHAITSFFEVPYGAKPCTYAELKNFFKKAGFEKCANIDISETQMIVYLEV